MAPPDAKPLLDYLDKEGNVMGLLSVFCVGTAALLLERLTGASPNTYLTRVWESGRTYVFIGSVLLLLAAAMFYRQRSTLLWVHGLLALAIARSHPPDEYFETVEEWVFWSEYKAAWTCAIVAFVHVACAVISPLCPVIGSWLGIVVGSV
jgi:hypothetical protein